MRRAQYANLDIIIFKPKIDTRDKKDKVVSHDDSEIECETVKKAADIYKRVKNYRVVGVDEAQFFDDTIVETCNILANKGLRVIVAGLDMDFKGVPFGPMPNLMATAEHVTKVHAVCSRSGNLAHFSYRKGNDKSVVLLGEVDEYEPLSRVEFYKAILGDKNKS